MIVSRQTHIDIQPSLQQQQPVVAGSLDVRSVRGVSINLATAVGGASLSSAPGESEKAGGARTTPPFLSVPLLFLDSCLFPAYTPPPPLRLTGGCEISPKIQTVSHSMCEEAWEMFPAVDSPAPSSRPTAGRRTQTPLEVPRCTLRKSGQSVDGLRLAAGATDERFCSEWLPLRCMNEDRDIAARENTSGVQW